MRQRGNEEEEETGAAAMAMARRGEARGGWWLHAFPARARSQAHSWRALLEHVAHTLAAAENAAVGIMDIESG